MSKRVLILGANGMLGHTCFEHFQGLKEIEAIGTWRANATERIKTFDVQFDSIANLIKELHPDWIINCIGTIKQKINEEDLISRNMAVAVNTEFPKQIASAVSGTRIKVLQIATDCVFQGDLGNYHEKSDHDAIDLYGRTKSDGEVNSNEFMNLRVSIIGRELNSSYSLTDWFLAQNLGGKVNGYTNHYWNGITTLAFAKIAAGIIQNGGFASGTFHIVPKDIVAKSQLLEMFRKEFNRIDISVNPINVSNAVDRTLTTLYPEMNQKLWADAGYHEVPEIDFLVRELAELG